MPSLVGEQERDPVSVRDVEIAGHEGGNRRSAALDELDGHGQPLVLEQPALDGEVDRRHVRDRQDPDRDLRLLRPVVAGRHGRARRRAGGEQEQGQHGEACAREAIHAATLAPARGGRATAGPDGHPIDPDHPPTDPDRTDP